MKHLAFLTTAIFLFALSCQKSQDPVSPGNPDENHPPNVPSFVSPDSGVIGQDTTIEISWFCNDQDGDNLFYIIHVGTYSLDLQA